MKAGIPAMLRAVWRRCPPKTGKLQAGRIFLPALLCALTARAVPPLRAQVTPVVAEEAAPDRGVSGGGARRARAVTVYVRAMRLLRQQGIAAALPVFRDVLALDPENSVLAGELAAVAAAAGQAAGARQMLEELAARYPDGEGPAVALAAFLVSRQAESVQAYGEALAMVRGAARRFPGSPGLCAAAVRLFAGDQRFGEAREAVRQTVARGSDDPAFWLAMAGAAGEAFPPEGPGKPPAPLVLECLEKASGLAGENLTLLEAAGDFYGKLHCDGLAAGCYRRVVSLDPDHPRVRHKLSALQPRPAGGRVTR